MKKRKFTMNVPNAGKAAESKQPPKRLPDTDFVEDEVAEKGPERLPGCDLVLETDSGDIPSRIPDHEFVEEEFEGGPSGKDE